MIIKVMKIIPFIIITFITNIIVNVVIIIMKVVND